MVILSALSTSQGRSNTLISLLILLASAVFLSYPPHIYAFGASDRAFYASQFDSKEATVSLNNVKTDTPEAVLQPHDEKLIPIWELLGQSMQIDTHENYPEVRKYIRWYQHNPQYLQKCIFHYILHDSQSLRYLNQR